MAAIGASAARGQLPAPAVLADVDAVAAGMPLSAEPFLIRGAMAQAEGDDARAERLFVAARERNARSRAARYFLADRYVRTGRTGEALSELTAFARLTQGGATLATALAQFAVTPGAAPQLAKLFRRSPELGPMVLSNLAGNPENAELILELWPSVPAEAPASSQDWQTRLLNALIERGDYELARRAWARFASVDTAPRGLFNAEFERSKAPPPFNWTYGTSGGVAEPLGAGRLQLLYYGREDAVLAEQLMTLAPGRYSIAFKLRGEVQPGALNLTIECVSGAASQMRLALQTGANGGQFTVPRGCGAQRLRISGSPAELPKPTEAVLSELSLRGGGL